MHSNNHLLQHLHPSSIQIQRALCKYPLWLQKEYMRRIKRQYEELYVVEDPKIHHWSAICPRNEIKKESQQQQQQHPYSLLSPQSSIANDENINIHQTTVLLSDDDNDYLSESHSAPMSPSPFSYSPHNPENTISDDRNHFTCLVHKY